MSALSAAAAQLLPGPDEAPRCADHQRSLGIDPGGSAIDTELLVLIDTPLPWPAQMADHDLLVDLAPETVLAGGRTRVVAVVPPTERPRHRLRVFWREGPSLGAVGFSFADRRELTTIVDELRRAHPARAAGVDPDVAVTTDLVLVCGHGARDQCCGTDGTRLAIDTARARPDLTIERTSHLGGHRFSPTAMLLPSGRMWADLDTETLLAILDRTVTPAHVADRCRGWWGAAMGPAQMAERASFARHGWVIDDSERVVTQVADDLYEVRWDQGRDRFRVRVAREVPTIACRSAGGLPAKPGLEYVVSDG